MEKPYGILTIYDLRCTIDRGLWPWTVVLFITSIVKTPISYFVLLTSDFILLTSDF
jgi:hypothetical protein